jgi:hypothetical protein
VKIGKEEIQTDALNILHFSVLDKKTPEMI